MPRKRRTRQHVIADVSVNYVERFVLDAGHSVQRLTPDYGYDLILFTYDEQGYAEPGMAFLQLKAAETLKRSGRDYVFDLDIRDYHRWMFERYPVMLILFDAAPAGSTSIATSARLPGGGQPRGQRPFACAFRPDRSSISELWHSCEPRSSPPPTDWNRRAGNDRRDLRPVG